MFTSIRRSVSLTGCSVSVCADDDCLVTIDKNHQVVPAKKWAPVQMILCVKASPAGTSRREHGADGLVRRVGEECEKDQQVCFVPGQCFLIVRSSVATVTVGSSTRLDRFSSQSTSTFPTCHKTFLTPPQRLCPP